MKIARHATERHAILCFEDAFHGRTLTALALTSKIQPYRPGSVRLTPILFAFPTLIATDAPTT